MSEVDVGLLKSPVVVDACGRMDRKNAAMALNKSPQTLANWATQGVGPAPFSINGRAYYWAEQVIAYGRGEPLQAKAA